MSRKKTVVIIIAIVTTIALAAASIYIVRNVNEKPPVTVDQSVKPVANEQAPEEAQEMVYTSSLQGVDTVHWGQGGVTVTGTQDAATLSFNDDFKVAQGPDLFVYLSPNPAGEELGEFASLGQLQANEGAQEYVLPSNYKDYKTVVIWCRAFGVTFATAEFDFSS